MDSEPDSDMKNGYEAHLEDANAQIEAVSPADAARHLRDPGTVSLDLWSPREHERKGQAN